MKKMPPLLIAALCIECASFGGNPGGNRLEKMQTADNYRDGRFHNQQHTPLYTKNKFTIYWNFLFSKPQNLEPEKPPAIVRQSKQAFEKPPRTDLRLTWLGHSTYLLELAGKRVLVDPVFGKRSSPLSWAGPARFHEPPVSLADMPPVDVILISHDHYDHLDYESIVALRETTGHFIVPLGVGAHLEKWGVKKNKIIELNWHNQVQLDDLTLVCTPARHFSGRSFFDEYETLWSSWVIRSKSQNVFFSGDTGPMKEEFEKIGEKYGPFDYTIMQLGLYGKDWPFVHMTPAEAIAAHQQVKGRVLVPAHWGTFAMALHDWQEPIRQARQLTKEKSIPLVDAKPGEMLELGKPWSEQNPAKKIVKAD